MADKKISALTAAAIPLDGTEVLPIVQSGSTVKVANNDLRPKQIQSNATSGVLQIAGPAAAATRIMTTPDANFTAARTDAAQSFTGDQTLSTGNLVIGTSGKGIDFSATPGTGTSELFSDYEEGTWTPNISDGTNNATVDFRFARYTKVGRNVTIFFNIGLSSVGSVSGSVRVTGLPYTCSSANGVDISGAIVSQCSNFNTTAGQAICGSIANGNTFIRLNLYDTAGATTTLQSGELTNTAYMVFSTTYMVD